MGWKNVQTCRLATEQNGGRLMMSFDFEAEGLLGELRGEHRAARLALLEELAAEGVPFEELRRAAAEDRLALLPVERALAGGDPRYTLDEIAERSGLERKVLDRLWRALGMALAAEDEHAYTDADLEAASRVVMLLEGGVPEEGVVEVARVLAIAMSQVAAANRLLVREVFMHPGDTELEVAQRFRAVVETLGPVMGATLIHVFNIHVREQIRHDVLGAEQAAAGRVARTDVVTVCFADVVDFTGLGERLATDELGAVTHRLTALAAEVAVAPVRLVKLIGDAAMLVGPPREVLEAALALVEASEADEGMPRMRAGLASGRALERAGDYYGRPVNLASRLTELARPGTALASETVKDAAGEDGFQWSFARSRRLKGIEGSVNVYRCRRAEGLGPGA